MPPTISWPKLEIILRLTTAAIRYPGSSDPRAHQLWCTLILTKPITGKFTIFCQVRHKISVTGIWRPCYRMGHCASGPKHYGNTYNYVRNPFHLHSSTQKVTFAQIGKSPSLIQNMHKSIHYDQITESSNTSAMEVSLKRILQEYILVQEEYRAVFFLFSGFYSPK